MNMCRSAGHGEWCDIYASKVATEDNSLTRLNVALRFLHSQKSEAGTILFWCRHFDLLFKELEEYLHIGVVLENQDDETGSLIRPETWAVDGSPP